MANMKIADGALFQDAPIVDGKVHPVMHCTLEVAGVRLNLAVWPSKTSAKGTKYWPVSGEYARDEVRRLVDVNPTMNASASVQAKTEAAEPSDMPF